MRGFSLFLFFVFVLFFLLGRFYSYSYMQGKDDGHKDYYKGKVECVEVFNKIECRLKPNNS